MTEAGKGRHLKMKKKYVYGGEVLRARLSQPPEAPVFGKFRVCDFSLLTACIPAMMASLDLLLEMFLEPQSETG